MESGKLGVSVDAHCRTIEACAWLIDIAQHAVDNNRLPSIVVKWLDALGSGAYGSLHGGMGGTPPMERSAADVELLAFLVDYRGLFRSQVLASAARHDKQTIGACEALQ